ncbi:MAG: nucleotidyltransferase domain-containing protein [Gemmatimonadales bacterium]
MQAHRTSATGSRSSRSTLGRLLGSEARAKVLTAILLGTPERYYVRNLAKRLSLPPTAVSRELVTLEQLGLVRRQTEGRRLYCELNRQASVVPELRILVLKLGGIAEALRTALEEQRTAIRWAFLYGSMASGRNTASSDVDLFVVGDMTSIELAELVRPTAEVLGREINQYLVTPAEFREKRRAGHHFVSRVLAGSRIELIGNVGSAEAAH